MAHLTQYGDDIVKYSGLLVPVGLITLALASILTSTQATGMANTNEVLTTDGYSILIGSILLAVCSYDVIYTIWRSRTAQGKTQSLPASVMKLIASVIGVGVLYVFGISYLGFHISTFLFLTFFVLALEEWNKKRILPAIGYAVVVNLVCFIVFRWLHIYLPETWLL